MTRITPENMTVLNPKQIVSIGTNESGINGAGIAAYAEKNWGWKSGVGFGPQGQCFGIPTKDWRIKQLPLDVIENYVQRYIAFGKLYPKLEHMVTKIGCGLAGYSVPDIAPMFYEVRNHTAFWLPQDFRDFYNGTFKIEVNHDTTDRDRQGNVVGF